MVAGSDLAEGWMSATEDHPYSDGIAVAVVRVIVKVGLEL